MDRYRDTASITRNIDAMANAMRKRQRRLGKQKRKALISLALTMPLTDGKASTK
jgi:hypothetical protein